MQYRNKLSLLNSAKKPSDIVDENCPLYSLIEWLLLVDAKVADNSAIVAESYLHSYIYKLKNPNGFYNNEVSSPTYMSHDQMRSICVFSVLTGKKYHRDIWSKMVKSFLTYDNISGKANIKRIVHPRDVIFIGALNKNWICLLLMPLYQIMALYMFKHDMKIRPTLRHRVAHYLKTRKWLPVRKIQKTDGEIIYWVESHVGSWSSPRIVLNYFNSCIEKRFGSWNKVFLTYFPDQSHPINLAVKQNVNIKL